MSTTEQQAPRRNSEVEVMTSSQFSVVAVHEFRRAARDGEFVSILLLHVEQPAPVASGAATVDPWAVRALGQLVALELRGSDVVALVGEHELALLLPDTDADQVVVVLEHLNATAFDLAESGRRGLVARVGAATLSPGEPGRELPALMAAARQHLGSGLACLQV